MAAGEAGIVHRFVRLQPSQNVSLRTVLRPGAIDSSSCVGVMEMPEKISTSKLDSKFHARACKWRKAINY